jgi:iron complex outermembrane receptor protein
LTPSRQARVGYRRDLFALRTRLPIRALNGDLTLSTQAISAETVTTDPLLELGWSLAETRTPGQRVEQSVEATERPFEHLRLSQRFAVAVDSMQRFERRSGTLDPAVSARRLGARVGGSFELQLARDWFIDGTAGLSCNDTSTGLLAVCDRVDGDGRVGLRYRRPSYELYSNVGRYLREPTLGELYGVAPLVRGNADLVPERGTSYELGARVQWRGARRTPLLYADVAAFSRFSDDLVTYVRTAQGFLTPTNDKRARALGGELVVGTAPVSFFEASSQLSLLDARDTSPDRTARNDVLPFHSRLVSTTLVTFEQRFESDWLSQVGTTARWLYQSSRYADPAGLGVIPAQSSLDLELFLRSLDRISTRARVANLLDQRRFDVVGFPLPGRSAFVSVEATW